MSIPLNVRTFVAPGFAQNGYIAWRDGSSSAICIDPGSTAAAMLELLAAEGLKLDAILLTHAHLDHVEGVAAMVRATEAPVYLHPADRFLYDNVSRQAQQFGMQVDPPPPPDRELAHAQQLELAGLVLHVRHVPGHSPGHVLLHVPDAGCAFVGDIVFQGSIGRTDLPGGDFEELITGIRSQVLSLPDETTLLTGHGPPTTPGHERATNPFLVAHYGGGLA